MSNKKLSKAQIACLQAVVSGDLFFRSTGRTWSILRTLGFLVIDSDYKYVVTAEGLALLATLAK